MRLGPLLLLLAYGSSGCDADACRSHTLRLTLSYGFAASATDSLTLDVRVGTSSRRYQRQLSGGASDTLEVVFASYPAAASVSVDASVSRDGQTIGGGRTESTLQSDCSALTVRLERTGVGGADLDAGVDLAQRPEDQGLGGGNDQAMPAGADLALPAPDLAPSTPTLSLPDQHNTAQSATNSSGGMLWEDRCPAGYALIGFNFAETSAIIEDKGICAHIDLKPTVGGGWQGTWGATAFLPYHGNSGDPGTQVVCPSGSFVRGFSGWSAAYVESIIFLCATIVVSADKQVSLSYNGATSLYGQNLGMDYGTIICPTNEVAVMRRETRGTNLPPYSIGLACSSISAK